MENPFAAFGCGLGLNCPEKPIYSMSRFDVDCVDLIQGEKHNAVTHMYFCPSHVEEAMNGLAFISWTRLPT
jgi:hypothetical protein